MTEVMQPYTAKADSPHNRSESMGNLLRVQGPTIGLREQESGIPPDRAKLHLCHDLRSAYAPENVNHLLSNRNLASAPGRLYG